MEGRGRTTRRGRGEGWERGNGEGRERGKLGDSALVVGGRRPWVTGRHQRIRGFS